MLYIAIRCILMYAIYCFAYIAFLSLEELRDLPALLHGARRSEGQQPATQSPLRRDRKGGSKMWAGGLGSDSPLFSPGSPRTTAPEPEADKDEDKNNRAGGVDDNNQNNGKNNRNDKNSTPVKSLVKGVIGTGDKGLGSGDWKNVGSLRYVGRTAVFSAGALCAYVRRRQQPSFERAFRVTEAISGLATTAGK